MIDFIRRWISWALSLADSLDWLAPLLMRLFVGYFFFETGWGKLQDLPAFTKHFVEWGIPYPAFNAALSAYTECIGGALTIAGLAMRFVSIPMIINMIVAILSVKLKELHSLSDFVEWDEPLYALAFFWLMMSGAGKVSADYILAGVLGLGRQARDRFASERG